MSDTLKPCPFCGKPGGSYPIVTSFPGSNSQEETEVGCYNTQCGVWPRTSDPNPATARRRWNRRPNGSP